jgi:hypothetical protein
LANGQFPPGMSGNPGGAPKGLAEVRDLARGYTVLAITTLARIAEKGKTETAQIAASTALLDRGWGKPTQILAGDPDMPPVRLTVEEERAAREQRRVGARAAIQAAFTDHVRREGPDDSMLPGPEAPESRGI